MRNVIERSKFSSQQIGMLLDYASAQENVLTSILDGMKLFDENIDSSLRGYMYSEIKSVRDFYRYNFGRETWTSDLFWIMYDPDHHHPQKYLSDWGCNFVASLARQDSYFLNNIVKK